MPLPLLFCPLPPEFLFNCGTGVIFPIVLSRLIPKIGFAWTVRTVAFMSVVLLVFSVVTVKARLPPRKSSTRWLEPVKAFKMEPGYRWLILASFFGFWGSVVAIAILEAITVVCLNFCGILQILGSFLLHR
jgi:hypothetical protein